MPDLSDHDTAMLRLAFAEARRGRQAGSNPFGGVIADADGVIASAFNTEKLDGETTGHAEMNALRLALRDTPRERLAGATCYASYEPCAMCAGAVFAAGLRRVIFGAPKGEPVPADGGVVRPGIGLRCAAVLARAPEPVVVLGPCLTDEARAVLA
jgi:tRNA(Arg) A34 adenosine deaminase TadA